MSTLAITTARKALEQIEAWVNCAAISSAEEFAQSAGSMGDVCTEAIAQLNAAQNPSRDPRTDPWPGDVLKSYYGSVVVVMQRNDDVVMYIDIWPEQDEIKAKYLAAWVEEHKNTNASFMSEIIYVSHF